MKYQPEEITYDQAVTIVDAFRSGECAEVFFDKNLKPKDGPLKMNVGGHMGLETRNGERILNWDWSTGNEGCSLWLVHHVLSVKIVNRGLIVSGLNDHYKLGQVPRSIRIPIIGGVPEIARVPRQMSLEDFA